MQVCTLLQTDNHATTPPLSAIVPEKSHGNKKCEEEEEEEEAETTKFWPFGIALKWP